MYVLTFCVTRTSLRSCRILLMPEPSLGGSAPIHPVDSSLVHIWIPCCLPPGPLGYELLGSNDCLLLRFLFLGLCCCQALTRRNFRLSSQLVGGASFSQISSQKHPEKLPEAPGSLS